MSLTDEESRLIGGSDAAAVLGVHPRKTPLDVWRRIVEGHQIEKTKPMRRGQLMEPVIRQMYVDETGAKLHGPTKFRRGNLRASLDDRADNKVVEFKSVNVRMAHEYGEPGSDEVPVSHLIQCQFYMALSGLPVADLAALMGGDELQIFTIQEDKELQAMAMERCEGFYRDHIVTKRPPPLDASEGCKEWLHKRFPRESGPMLQATAQIDSLAQEFMHAKLMADELEAKKEALRRQLEEFIGEAEGVSGIGWRITWRAVAGRKSTDWEALARSLGAKPEDIARHVRQGNGYRAFKVQTKKEQP